MFAIQSISESLSFFKNRTSATPPAEVVSNRPDTGRKLQRRRRGRSKKENGADTASSLKNAIKGFFVRV